MTPIHISKTVMRRYVLGRQGLWPGRRWMGKEGAAEAIRAMGGLQIDPLVVVARSHDLILHSRVLDYRPEHLITLLYDERRFFEYGGGLFVYPIEELPYWRLVMRRRSEAGREATFAAQNPAVINEVREEIRRRGPLGNRDFAGSARVNSYRAGKDSGLALYYLWISGELMIHSRQRFEKRYDLRERVAPPALNRAASDEEAEQFFARKASAGLGLRTARYWRSRFANIIERPVSQSEAQQRIKEQLAAGELATATVEGRKDLHYVPAADAPLIATLLAGGVPDEWQPLATTTEQEVTFLAPLEPVSARGMAKPLFDFDYIWEVYKPAAVRRWGYYTLPILYGERLVARLDPKLERRNGTLVINGLWLEDEVEDDPGFVPALARGLAHFAHFHQAQRLDLSTVQPRPLAEQLSATATALLFAA